MARTRKILILLLAVCLLVSVLAASALAVDNGGYVISLYFSETHARPPVSGVGIWSYICVSNRFQLPNGPIRPGFLFTGWKENERVYQAGDWIDVSQDRTFYGQWIQTHPFTDLDENADYFYDIMHVYANNLMNGTSEMEFSPNAPFTRAMMWTVLARMNDVETGGDPWYAQAQAWAVQTGISDGLEPEREMSRQEVAVMLYRQVGSPEVDGQFTGYYDVDQVADWARDGLCWALQTGVIKGDTEQGILDPCGIVPRWELASALVQCSQRNS